jgi:CRP-like cAMP-binding protein
MRRLVAVSSARTVKAGTVLARVGFHPSKVIVVQDGELELSVRTRAGRRIVALVRAGGVIADVPALCGTPMQLDAIAIRDSRVIEVDPERLIALLRSSPELSLRWIRSLAWRLLASQRHALALLREGLPAQVAAVLLLEQETDGDGYPKVQLSQEAIARLLGASRQSVSRILSGWRARGVVRTGYRSILLLDPQALTTIAGIGPVTGRTQR